METGRPVHAGYSSDQRVIACAPHLSDEDLLKVEPKIHAQTSGSISRLSQKVGESLGSVPIDKSSVQRGSQMMPRRVLAGNSCQPRCPPSIPKD
ncbi:hypothetical protein Nepgr_021016 [Nepenthes gracilis]|uniref:Uncharacterized protein n=1 Tax=Nepenthes gracilis TaxID=150966 RepID=A0AAD3SWI0_NEPGR|nr:hypothetical protein Nepgr_021016 [Nepenthes gracilis]